MSDQKIRCAQVTRSDQSGCYVQPLDEAQNALDGELDGADIGTRVTFELCEYTQAELAALPEFEGW